MDGNLQLKYNKIAVEYSKLRSQLPVLKKAVTDEQARCNELKDLVKVKDKNLRIAEAEVDSLNFRNQQLTCRVGILLQELDEVKNPHKKSSKSQSHVDKHATFDEEFTKKIIENAELRSTLHDHQEIHNFEVNELKNEIVKLREELKCLKKAQLEVGAVSETSDMNEEISRHISFLNENHNAKDSIEKTGNEILDQDLTVFKTHLNTNPFGNKEEFDVDDTKEKKSHWEPQENSVRWIIQEALEEQLLQTQQLLQRTKNDYESVSNNNKTLETKFKELEEKLHCITSKSVVPVKGRINYIPDEEAKAREIEIKRCYQHRIDLVSNESQIIKSKLQTFEKEVAAMRIRLETETNNCVELSKQVEAERINVRNVKDELSTTVDNYNAQLSAMSDHVTVQNDLIQKYKDTIEELQFQLEKVNKKGKK